ncbi:N-acetyltransferase [Oleomonas cavernae]|uniref:N-acetyltransferase n=1 Tax=Oleomonas cavernae TaxID=2320859 RepID=A0A418WCR0_9PROT|nr:GNAT family N-acetyltransferase [Oleomonas cavernae]RJF87766.1 N-acetyltransferase [Oleomonas cavernae]
MKFTTRPLVLADLAAIPSLAQAAIPPAFDHESLTDEQRAENARITASASAACADPGRTVLVAADEAGRLAGFVIVDHSDPGLPELDWLIVAPHAQGKGAADCLMQAVIRDDVPMKLGVIHYNARAIAFYERWGFRDTGRIAGTHKIPRKLMIREPG